MGYIGNQSAKIVHINIDRFRGEVADIAALNLITGMASGDMYKLISTNHAYMYDGSAWVDMGDIEGPQGPKGAGITSIIRTTGDGSPGTTDIYTITYTDTSTSTFNVYNGEDGVGISSIARTSGDGSEGTTDTYTITYSDTSTSTFNVKNGTAGTINHIAKTGTVGTTDTYTAYADAAKTQPLGSFEVYNGVDGLSAYEVAANNGFVGTEAEWLTSLDGQDGIDGKSITTVTFTSTTDASGLPAQSGGIDTYTISYSDATTNTYDIYNGTDVTNVNVIDDTQITLTNTWSASKIDSELSSKADAANLDLKLPLTGGTMTGAITAIRETQISLGVSSAIDLSLGNVFTKSVNSDTTFSVLNCLSSGTSNSFILELVNAGSFTITWFSGIKWAEGIAPVLTASGVDVLGFYSYDGGVTWKGLVLGNDMK